MFCLLMITLCPYAAEYQPNEELPVSSSDVAISEAFPVYLAKSNRMTSYEKPRPLELSEIPGIVEEYVQGARNAMAAGRFCQLLGTRRLGRSCFAMRLRQHQP